MDVVSMVIKNRKKIKIGNKKLMDLLRKPNPL